MKIMERNPLYYLIEASISSPSYEDEPLEVLSPPKTKPIPPITEKTSVSIKWIKKEEFKCIASTSNRPNYLQVIINNEWIKELRNWYEEKEFTSNSNNEIIIHYGKNSLILSYLYSKEDILPWGDKRKNISDFKMKVKVCKNKILDNPFSITFFIKFMGTKRKSLRN